MLYPRRRRSSRTQSGMRSFSWMRPGRASCAPKLERMWAEQDYLHPKARVGYFPCNSDGNELVIFDPEDHDKELERLVTEAREEPIEWVVVQK